MSGEMGKAWTIIHADEGGGFTVPEGGLDFITAAIQYDEINSDAETAVYTDEQMNELEERLRKMEPGETLNYDAQWSVKCAYIDLDALENGPEWGGW